MWRKGPLPPGTYNWGAVVPTDLQSEGFYFADFMGDHAILYPGERTVRADEVAFYDNGLTLPPHPAGQARAGVPPTTLTASNGGAEA
jgi:hypothetical protein